MPSPPYIELRCRSAFSFLDGTNTPEDLIRHAERQGHAALALGDRNGVYGAPRFFRAARETGTVRPIVGAEITVADAPPLLLLVEDRTGYRNLCRLITAMKAGREKNDPGTCAPHDLIEAHKNGLLALAGGQPRPDWDRLTGIFGPQNVFAEMQRHFDDTEARRNRRACLEAQSYGLQTVASNDVRYVDKSLRRIHDVLTCAREKTTVDEVGRRLLRNGERHLKSPLEMARLFSDQKQARFNTLAIAERCQFTLADLGYAFPTFPVPHGESEQSYLEKMTWWGASQRYRPMTDKVRRQLAHELTVVGKLGLAGYFLVVWDIVRFANTNSILAQGRGSAANSAICYALGITAVDPVGMDLLFERFLSEERIQSAPSAADRIPDIDLDLPSGERRERVIQYVYERYGRASHTPDFAANSTNHNTSIGNASSAEQGPAPSSLACGAAMTANVITFRPRMAVRNAGRALGFTEAQMTRMSKHLPHALGATTGVPAAESLAEALQDAGFPTSEPRTRLLAETATALLNLPRHLGQHSGGMVLCAGRLDDVVPLEPASMPGRTVVQWDKDDCADLGIVKVDLLGLGMLAVLEDAAPLIAEHEGITIDYAHLPQNDKKVYDMLCAADTVGVFQVESRAQMATLPRMKPRRFYDLVVEVAIIRPGPIVGNMVNPYLQRRLGREPVTYAHPCLEPILKRTLGVPLFQEQLIRMAMAAAGFSGGQAEELRRAMGFKRSMERMSEIEHELRAGMKERGIQGDNLEEIVTGIKSFALYGFPESHAASFALIAYASAYLKAHHGAAFLCALLNNWPMGFYHPATLVTDAARHGIETRPVDVTQSQWACTLEPAAPAPEPEGATGQTGHLNNGLKPQHRGKTDGASGAQKTRKPPQSRLAVRLGLKYVAGLREAVVARLVAERERKAFVSIGDLSARVCPRADEMAALAYAGALAPLGGDRRAALWQAEALGRSGSLFARAKPEAPSPLPVMSESENVIADLSSTGITTGAHPVSFVRAELKALGITPAAELTAHKDGQRARLGGVVIVRQRPMTAKGIIFVTLEDETGFANVVVMPDVFQKWRQIIISNAALMVEGQLQIREGVVHLLAERFAPLPGSADVASRSHDFH